MDGAAIRTHAHTLTPTRTSSAAAAAPSERAPPGVNHVQPVSDRAISLRERLTGVLQKLRKRDCYGFFLHPVDTKLVPDYLEVISHPMDLSTMTRRLADGYYLDWSALEADFALIISNACTYNPPETKYHSEALKLKAYGDRIVAAAKAAWQEELDTQKAQPGYHKPIGSPVAAPRPVRSARRAAVEGDEAGKPAATAAGRRRRHGQDTSGDERVGDSRYRSQTSRGNRVNVEDFRFARRVRSVVTGDVHAPVEFVTPQIDGTAIALCEDDFEPEVDVWRCEICDDTSNDGEDFLLRCSNPACRVVVHKRCYGVGVVTDAEWMCDPCSLGIATPQLACALCTCHGGALKPTDRGVRDARPRSELRAGLAAGAPLVPVSPFQIKRTQRARSGGGSTREEERAKARARRALLQSKGMAPSAQPSAPAADKHHEDAPVKDSSSVVMDASAAASPQRIEVAAEQNDIVEEHHVADESNAAEQSVAIECEAEPIDARAPADGDAMDLDADDSERAGALSLSAGPVTAEPKPEVVRVDENANAEAPCDVVGDDVPIPVEWAHVLCAVYVPETYFGDVPTMSPVCGLHRINSRRATLSCRVCKQQGLAVIQCTRPACGVGVHPQCARNACWELVYEATKAGFWQHAVHCPRHDDRPPEDITRVPFVLRQAFGRALLRRGQQPSWKIVAHAPDVTGRLQLESAPRRLLPAYDSRTKQQERDVVEHAMQEVIGNAAPDLMSTNDVSDDDSASVLMDPGAPPSDSWIFTPIDVESEMRPVQAVSDSDDTDSGALAPGAQMQRKPRGRPRGRGRGRGGKARTAPLRSVMLPDGTVIVERVPVAVFGGTIGDNTSGYFGELEDNVVPATAALVGSMAMLVTSTTRLWLDTRAYFLRRLMPFRAERVIAQYARFRAPRHRAVTWYSPVDLTPGELQLADLVLPPIHAAYTRMRRREAALSAIITLPGYSSFLQRAKTTLLRAGCSHPDAALQVGHEVAQFLQLEPPQSTALLSAAARQVIEAFGVEELQQFGLPHVFLASLTFPPQHLGEPPDGALHSMATVDAAIRAQLIASADPVSRLLPYVHGTQRSGTGIARTLPVHTLLRTMPSGTPSPVPADEVSPYTVVRIMQSLAVPALTPSHVVNPREELDTRVLETTQYVAVHASDLYRVVFEDAALPDRQGVRRFFSMPAPPVSSQPKPAWTSTPITATSLPRVPRGVAQDRDPAFRTPRTRPRSHVLQRTGLDDGIDGSLAFGGWGDGEDFSELHRVHATAWTPGMAAIAEAATAAGFCANTRFRFATVKDAAVLFTLNRVNDAFVCMEDFVVTLRAKNEFVLVAVRDVVTADGAVEEHIVGFVNYYFSWFSDHARSVGERPSPVPVVYVATLQAVKPETHADIMQVASPAHRARLQTPLRAAAATLSVGASPASHVVRSLFDDRDSNPGGAAAAPYDSRTSGDAALPSPGQAVPALATHLDVDIADARPVAVPPAAVTHIVADANADADSAGVQDDVPSKPLQRRDASNEDMSDDEQMQARALRSSNTAPAAAIPPGSIGSRTYYPYATASPGSSSRTGTVLLALAMEHGRSSGMISTLVDSTDAAYPYYVQVVGMTPLLQLPGRRYRPMHTPCEPEVIAHVALPRYTIHDDAAIDRVADLADALRAVPSSVVYWGPAADDEVGAELLDCQSILAALMSQTDASISVLLRGIRDAEIGARDMDAMLDRRLSRKVFSVYQAFENRRSQALEAARQAAEADQDASCGVCGGADSMPKNQIIFCDKCNLAVHQACYGVTAIPAGEWYCAPCAAGLHPVSVPCELCAIRGGPLRATAPPEVDYTRDASIGGHVFPRQWVHVLCARMHYPQLRFTDPQRDNTQYVCGLHSALWDDPLHPARDWLQFIRGERAQPCCVCGSSTGVTIACAVPGCQGRVHAICAADNALVSQVPPITAGVQVIREGSESAANGAVRFIASSTLPMHPDVFAAAMRSGVLVNPSASDALETHADAPEKRTDVESSAVAASVPADNGHGGSDVVQDLAAGMGVDVSVSSARSRKERMGLDVSLGTAYITGGPSVAESSERTRLYVFCASHRVVTPGRLTQGAQALIEQLAEELRQAARDGRSATAGAAVAALPLSTSGANMLDPRSASGALAVLQPVSLAEAWIYRALRLATGTMQFAAAPVPDSVPSSRAALLATEPVVTALEQDVESKAVDTAPREAITSPVRPASNVEALPFPLPSSSIEDQQPPAAPTVPALLPVPGPEPASAASSRDSLTPDTTAANLLPVSIVPADEVVCGVCGDADSEEGNEIVFCERCDVRVHQLCYGIAAVPSSAWLCDPCSRGLDAPSLSCALCSAKGGALKAVESVRQSEGESGAGLWAHVVCGLWVPETRFGDSSTMSPVMGYDDIPEQRKRLRCRICKLARVGAPIQCTNRACTSSYHVTCGMHAGFYFGYDEVPVRGGGSAEETKVVRVTFCPKHMLPAHQAAILPVHQRPMCYWTATTSAAAGAIASSSSSAHSHAALEGSVHAQVAPLSVSASSQPARVKAASLPARTAAGERSARPSAAAAGKSATSPAASRKPAASAAARDVVTANPPPSATYSTVLEGATGTPKRYPPILLPTCDPTHPDFQPLARVLVALYGMRVHVGALNTANTVEDMFLWPDPARVNAGVVSIEELSRRLAEASTVIEVERQMRRKVKRMLEPGAPGDAGVAARDVFLSALTPMGIHPSNAVFTGDEHVPGLQDEDEEAARKRRQCFGPFSFLAVDSNVLFGARAVAGASSRAAARARARQATTGVVARRSRARDARQDDVTVGGADPHGLNALFMRQRSRAAAFMDAVAACKAALTVEIVETDEMGNAVNHSVTVDDTRYCICQKTYAQDSSVMIACGGCEAWFHVRCMKLRVCPEHTPGYIPPPPGMPHTEAEAPPNLTCLITPEDVHLDVRETYTCPKCSNTRFGVGGTAAGELHA